jgi:hypothetical protein
MSASSLRIGYSFGMVNPKGRRQSRPLHFVGKSSINSLKMRRSPKLGSFRKATPGRGANWVRFVKGVL